MKAVEKLKSTASRLNLDWRYVAVVVALFILGQAVACGVEEGGQCHNWQALLIGSFFVALPASPTRNAQTFFWGAKDGQETVGSGLLTMSLFGSWIFAKSVLNASNLGANYGLMGAFGYAAYYLSYPAVSMVCGALRKQGSISLVEAVKDAYGPTGGLFFSLVLLYRLYGEIYSNAMVIGLFSGTAGSPEYWAGVAIAIVVPFAYVAAGGLRASLVTDVLLSAMMGILVVVSAVVLGAEVVHKDRQEVLTRIATGPASHKAWDLVVLATIQALTSYGFHDAVLVDRSFMSSLEGSKRAFTLAGSSSFITILLCGFMGMAGNAAYGSAKLDVVVRAVTPEFGWVLTLLMVSSSISTLDSTASSLAKLALHDVPSSIPEAWRARFNISPTLRVNLGRAFLLFMGVIGGLTVLAPITVLDATLLSGTTVLGLFPALPYTAFVVGPRVKQHPLAFALPLAFSLCIGISYQVTAGKAPAFQSLKIGTGPYAALLGTNLMTVTVCVVLFAAVTITHRLLGGGRVASASTKDISGAAIAPAPSQAVAVAVSAAAVEDEAPAALPIERAPQSTAAEADVALS